MRIVGFEPKGNLRPLPKTMSRKSSLSSMGSLPKNLVPFLGSENYQTRQTAATKIAVNYSANNIRKILDHSILNEDVENKLERAWVKKTLTESNHSQLRRILNTAHLKNEYRNAFEEMWVRKLLEVGNANSLKNALRYNMNRKLYTKLSNAWNIRRHTSENLRRYINHLSQYNTKLTRQTIQAMRNELTRRRS